VPQPLLVNRLNMRLSRRHTFFCLSLLRLLVQYRTINSEALDFLVELGRRIGANSKDNREASFLFQRLSVLIQRFNAVAFRGSFALEADR
jgi:hypothetical protein